MDNKYLLSLNDPIGTVCKHPGYHVGLNSYQYNTTGCTNADVSVDFIYAQRNGSYTGFASGGPLS